VAAQDLGETDETMRVGFFRDVLFGLRHHGRERLPKGRHSSEQEDEQCSRQALGGHRFLSDVPLAVWGVV
jgi:hypothetical protein